MTQDEHIILCIEWHEYSRINGYSNNDYVYTKCNTISIPKLNLNLKHIREFLAYKQYEHPEYWYNVIIDKINRNK